MHYSINIFISFIATTMLLISITGQSMNEVQVGKWSIIRSLSVNYDINSEVHKWSAIFCHAMGRPVTIFSEAYLTNQSHVIENFFKELNNYWYDQWTKCTSTMLLQMNHVTYSKNTNINLLWRNEWKKCFTTGLSAPKVKTFFFNNPSSARVILTTLELTDLLMKYDFNFWNRRQYVVVLVILENNKKVCPENIDRLIMKILVDILENLWKKRGVYNVFIGFPLLLFHEPRLWTYDPFYRNGIHSEFGKIVEIDLNTSPNFKQLKNLQGYKLDIGFFDRKLTSSIKPMNTNHDHHSAIDDSHGTDARMIQTLSEYFNFTVNIVPPSRGVKYGYILKNGTAIGTLGDVAYRRIHASFNSQYVKDYVTNIASSESVKLLDIIFTVPIDWDRVCIIVPASQEIPRWLRTFIYLDPSIWICLLGTIILASIVWYFLRYHHHSSSSNYFECPRKYLAVFIDSFMLMTGAPVRTTNILIERIFVGLLGLLGLIIMCAFSGTLYHSFTHDIYYHQIETLEELDASGLFIGTSSPNLIGIFGITNSTDDSSTFSRLASKMINVAGSKIPTIEMAAYGRKISAIYREKLFLIAQHHYIDFKGRSLLHLVSECPQAYHLAYLMPANSIFLESFNSIITILRETGIAQFWQEATTYHLINIEIELASKKEKTMVDKPNPFSIEDMQICFLILGFGLVMSIIVFIIECMDMKWIKCIITFKLYIFKRI